MKWIKAVFWGVFFFFYALYGLEEKPYYINDEIWNWVKPYFLPSCHELKPCLDKIFSEKRVLASVETLKTAGFKNVHPRRYTGVIVASHPKMPGYLFKMYTDKQSFHKDRPEWQTWLCRIWGTKLIKDKIESLHIENWFSVPEKWLYCVPNPEYANGNRRKDFILVVEKKELVSPRKNTEYWRSDAVTKDRLKSFFYLVTSLGLRDCAKPDNAPFCKDGKIAFIDTEVVGEWPIEYQKLTSVLSLKRKGTWKKLIRQQREVSHHSEAIAVSNRWVEK